MNDGKEFQFEDVPDMVDGDLTLRLIDRYPGDPARNYVPAYRFGLRRTADNVPMGSIELRVGNPEHLVSYGGHIGYCVAPQYRGHRYAARGCAMLLDIARHHGLSPVWITCDPDNVASRRTCEIIGARLVEIVNLPEDSDMYREGKRTKCRYRIDVGSGTPTHDDVEILEGRSEGGESGRP